MKAVLFLLLLLSACSAPANDASIESLFPAVAPKQVGLSSDSLALIENHLQWAMASELIAGGVALVARESKIVYHKAFGFADRAKTEKLTTDHIFRLASMTRPITCVAIMQLYDQGKLKAVIFRPYFG